MSKPSAIDREAAIAALVEGKAIATRAGHQPDKWDTGIDAAITVLRALPAVDDEYTKAAVAFAEEYYADRYHLDSVGLGEAWDRFLAARAAKEGR